MDLSMKLCVALLLILVVSEGHGLVQVALARECQSPSHAFKGLCASDTNCASVCLTEGFTGGKCVGFRQRCFCTRNC
ncbi:defensin Ec-AMP-D2-like [Lolium perenne]|uniref:defensin Ec-AMP-D2-like n=1 Tax=Lolium perenne TaxID=4522 RepID=UPI0021F688F7|nr:defensin Ec-AMP-D2-like [Lolium perenne]